MRVAYVCLDPGVPVFGRKGSSIHCQEVMRAMIRRGFDVELFARRLGDDVPVDLSQINVHRIGGKLGSKTEHREQKLADVNLIVTQMLQNAGPFDLVYERYSLWNFAAMEFANTNEIPGILEVNSPLIHEQKTYRALVNETKAKSIRATCFKNATSIIAVSDEVANRIRSIYYARDKTSVVANGVNCEKFDSILEARKTQDTSKDNPKSLTIGFLGTLKPWHGVSTLIDGFALVRAARPDVRLQIVGDGPERDRLETRLRRYSLEVQQSVDWTGAIANQDVPKTLANFDIAVAPYPDLQDFYFSPLKILEYMAAGLPIVASEIGQIPSLIRHDGSGLLVKTGSEQQLADSILRLCHDDNLRERLGKEARRKAVKQHTWQHVVARILETIPLSPNRVGVH